MVNMNLQDNPKTPGRLITPGSTRVLRSKRHLLGLPKTDRIAKIDPNTGDVDSWIDLTGLLTPEEKRRANVLNGIAYDANMDRLFVTGKLWPKLFEIVIVPEPSGLVVMALSIGSGLAVRPRRCSRTMTHASV